jgi:Tol biopolymer transport system component
MKRLLVGLLRWGGGIAAVVLIGVFAVVDARVRCQDSANLVATVAWGAQSVANLFLVDADTGQFCRHTHALSVGSYGRTDRLAWSADGSRLLMPGDYDVALTQAPLDQRPIGWLPLESHAPDGGSVAYLDIHYDEVYNRPVGGNSYASEYPASLRLRTTGGEDRYLSIILPWLKTANPRRRIVWSPTGEAIAHDIGGQVWVVDLDTGNGVGGWSGSDPAWSPDGAWLVHSAGGWSGHPTWSALPGDLILADPEGRYARVVGRGAIPQFAPTGDRIAYIDDASRLVVQPLDAEMQPVGDARVVSVGAVNANHLGNTPYTWSPQGDRLAVVSAGRLQIVSADDPQAPPLVTVLRGIRIDWALWRPAGAAPLLRQAEGYPGELPTAFYWLVIGTLAALVPVVINRRLAALSGAVIAWSVTSAVIANPHWYTTHSSPLPAEAIHLILNAIVGAVIALIVERLTRPRSPEAGQRLWRAWGLITWSAAALALFAIAYLPMWVY